MQKRRPIHNKLSPLFSLPLPLFIHWKLGLSFLTIHLNSFCLLSKNFSMDWMCVLYFEILYLLRERETETETETKKERERERETERHTQRENVLIDWLTGVGGWRQFNVRNSHLCFESFISKNTRSFPSLSPLLPSLPSLSPLLPFPLFPLSLSSSSLSSLSSFFSFTLFSSFSTSFSFSFFFRSLFLFFDFCLSLSDSFLNREKMWSFCGQRFSVISYKKSLFGSIYWLHSFTIASIIVWRKWPITWTHNLSLFPVLFLLQWISFKLKLPLLLLLFSLPLLPLHLPLSLLLRPLPLQEDIQEKKRKRTIF